MTLKLGKADPVYNPATLLLEHYTTRLAAPAHFPAPDLPWQMLGNDTAGDCVFAGAAHETMVYGHDSGRGAATFTTDAVLADYSAVTGYVPGDPSTDRGTNVDTALRYRAGTGIRDGAGDRHKIGAFAQLPLGHPDHIKYAIAHLSAVGIGIQFPRSAMDQFNAGRAWTVVAGAPIEGGHYVPLVGYDYRHVFCVTWGRLQPMSWGFLRHYCDESYGILSAELLNGAGVSPEGLDLAALRADLQTASAA